MSVLANANAMGASGVDTGDIGHSLRFRSAASAYLSRTPASAGNRRTWTWSGWVRLGALSANQIIFNQGGVSSNYTLARLNSSNQLDFQSYGTSSYNFQKVSSAVFRDPTSWHHVVFVLDATNTQARIYVNGNEVSYSTNTNPSNADQPFNQALLHHIGAATTPTQYFDGYMSRVCFVDGTALTPSSFGYLNTEINEWVSKSQSAVKAVVDAGGANSFMLDFDDPNFATYNVGKDYSSKGNHWTPNNFSLTAGTSYDWMLDVPGSSFATLNPIIPSAANITNGNLTSGTTAVRATMNALAYDSKWEVTAGGSAVTAGVISATGTTNTTTVTANKTFAFRLTTAGALDYKNVTDGGAWTSITTGLTGEQYPYGTTAAANWNFGQAPLHASATYQSAAGGYFYDTTTGFKALCQRNLPDGESITTSGSFTGTLAADGPYVDIKGVPLAMTINGNAVTFGTHADKTSSGFKLRTASSSYNNTGSNTYSVSSTGPKRKYSLAQGNP